MNREIGALNEIICPNYFQDLMVQRPHQLLKQFARNGYKAILHNINEKRQNVVTPEANYSIYNGIFPAEPKTGKRILWISYPPLYKYIGHYNEDFLVYDCLDYPGEQFSHWKRGLTELRERADVIFATSHALYEFNRSYQNKTFLCSNGVDFDFFNNKIQKTCPPKDLMNIKHPIAGYAGAVADWIDWKLIRYMASSGKISLVFIGPLHGLKEFPVKSEQVYFLGRKEYGELPAYLSCFDVCMVPFIKNKLTSACNPIKLYEYMSMGKPVICTDLEECRMDLVKTSKTPSEFYLHVLDALSHQSKTETQARIDFAKENSWEKRVAEIRAILEPMLEKKTSFQ